MYTTWGRYALRRVIYSFIFLYKVYFYIKKAYIKKAVGLVVTLRVKPLFGGKAAARKPFTNYERGTPFLHLAVQEIIYKTIDF